MRLLWHRYARMLGCGDAFKLCRLACATLSILLPLQLTSARTPQTRVLFCHIFWPKSTFSSPESFFPSTLNRCGIIRSIPGRRELCRGNPHSTSIIPIRPLESGFYWYDPLFPVRKGSRREKELSNCRDDRIFLNETTGFCETNSDPKAKFERRPTKSAKETDISRHHVNQYPSPRTSSPDWLTHPIAHPGRRPDDLTTQRLRDRPPSKIPGEPRTSNSTQTNARAKRTSAPMRRPVPSTHQPNNPSIRITLASGAISTANQMHPSIHHPTTPSGVPRRITNQSGVSIRTEGASVNATSISGQMRPPAPMEDRIGPKST
jgi:hypothetical protein